MNRGKKRFVYGRRKYKCGNGFKKSYDDNRSVVHMEIELHNQDENNNFINENIILDTFHSPSSFAKSINISLPQSPPYCTIHENSEFNKFKCKYWDDETLFTINEERIHKEDTSPELNNSLSDNCDSDEDYDYSNYSIKTEIVSENIKKETQLVGNRLVNIDFFIRNLQKMNNHKFPGNCNFSDMEIENEIRIGLNSKIVFVCKMCRVKMVMYTCKNSSEQLQDPSTNSKDCINVNEAAVLAIKTIGCGFYNLEEFLGILDVPCMTNFLYQKFSDNLRKKLLSTSSKIMMEAIEEEKKLALENGDIDHEGLPKITVVTDGAWSKRSYRSNYSALSGVVTLIGFYTRKVLWVGVKNKYCRVCETSKDPIIIQNHECNKNFIGASTGNTYSYI